MKEEKNEMECERDSATQPQQQQHQLTEKKIYRNTKFKRTYQRNRKKRRKKAEK